MTTVEHLKRIGSLELKKRLGPNLVRGLIASVFIHSAIISMGLLEWGEKVVKNPPTTVEEVVNIIEFLVPPSEDELTVTTVQLKQPVLDEIKIPIPTEQELEETEEDVEIEELDPRELLAHGDVDSNATMGESTGRSTGLGNSDTIAHRLAGFEKPWEKFVPCEIRPMPLSTNPQPEFPAMAALAGISAKVYVWVLVDVDGTVKEWNIVHVTVSNLGFEEAVGDIIGKWQFTPAVQSSRPVAVWVNIPFKFKLKH